MSPLTRCAAVVLIVTAAVSLSTRAAAQQPGQGRAKRYVATRAITVDPQSGALRLPTAAETQTLVDQLAVMINNSSEGLAPTTLPGGAKALNLQDRFASVMLARPSADGTSEIRCVTSFEEAAEFLGLVEDPNQI